MLESTTAFNETPKGGSWTTSWKTKDKNCGPVVNLECNKSSSMAGEEGTTAGSRRMAAHKMGSSSALGIGTDPPDLPCLLSLPSS